MDNTNTATPDASITGKDTQNPSNPETQSNSEPSQGNKEADNQTKDEDATDVQAELKKAKELANNYKIRAEKAEKKAKQSTPETTSNLSVKDLTALVKTNVNEDDYDDIFDYARLKKISIADALKTPLIKSMLSEKEEMRKTAEATATGHNAEGSTTSSPEALLNMAETKGEIPENPKDIQKLVEARLGKK